MNEEFSDDMTLGEAREWLRERFEEGADCPCCKQNVKLYRRKLTSSMTRGLIVLYHHQRHIGWNEWIHIPTLFAARMVCKDNMGSLLRLWSLIEQQPGEREDGSWRQGWYRITTQGINFVRGEGYVRKYVYLYNQTLIKRKDADPTKINVMEALGEKFDYTELMRATPDSSEEDPCHPYP